MPATVTGLTLRLLDRRSSIPLANATVTFVGSNNGIATKNADVYGIVDIDLPEGSYDVLIAAKGYLSSLMRGVGVLDGQRIEMIRGLVPGEGKKVEEEPSGAFGGVVLDRLDSPVMNIIVQANSALHSYTARTDRAGAYVMHNVLPGDYEIVFRSGDRALQRSSVTVERPRTFHRVDVKLLYL